MNRKLSTVIVAFTFGLAFVAAAPEIDNAIFFWCFATASFLSFCVVAGSLRISIPLTFISGTFVLISYLLASARFSSIAIKSGHLNLSILAEAFVHETPSTLISWYALKTLIILVLPTWAAALVERTRLWEPRFLLGSLYWGSVFSMPVNLTSSLSFRYFSLPSSPPPGAQLWGYACWVVEPVILHLFACCLVVPLLIVSSALSRPYRGRGGGDNDTRQESPKT